RLSEAVVETAAAGASDVREDSVECNLALFVRIETLVEQVTQEASILRDAFAKDTLGGSDRVLGVFGVRSEVANGSEAQARDHRISNDVDVFIDFARVKAAIQMDVAIACYQFAIDRVRELPV